MSKLSRFKRAGRLNCKHLRHSSVGALNQHSTFFHHPPNIFAITDKAVGHCFTQKSQTETLADHQTPTQPRSVINYLSFNSKDNLLQPNKEVGGGGSACLYLKYCCKTALAVLSYNPVSNSVCFTLERAERHYSNGDKVGWQSLSPADMSCFKT